MPMLKSKVTIVNYSDSYKGRISSETITVLVWGHRGQVTGS